MTNNFTHFGKYDHLNNNQPIEVINEPLLVEMALLQEINVAFSKF